MLDLSQILLELFRNSIEAQATKISILIHIQESNICIKITDNGTGFPQDNIFAKHYSTKDKSRGLGLFYIKETVDACNGTIILEKNSIEIHLPQCKQGNIADSVACMLLEDITLHLDYIGKKHYSLKHQGRCSYKQIIEIKTQLKEATHEII